MTQQRSFAARFVAGAAGTMLLSAAALLGTPAAASAASVAAVQQGYGYAVTPAQPYLHNPDAADWTGSYLVGGKQVWCIRFAYLAPDANQQYQPGQTLLTKWGTPVDPTTAAEISYLLLRYGTTTSNDDAAALAHLLHSWTSAPQNPGQLAPSNTYQTIAYDAPYHLNKLPAGAQAAVTALTADASANHGPWTTSMSAPSGAQVIGTAGNWTLNVLNAAGKGLANVSVNLTATNATLAGGAGTATVTTPADGSPLSFPVTPTGPNPQVVATLTSPAATPVLLAPSNPQVQQVVSTGGSTQLTAQASTKASTAPGSVTVTKLDANTKAPIAAASLRLTGADRTSPAVGQNGSPVTGSDGKPISGQTSSEGTLSFTNLQTPQQVCVLEVSPAPGYDQAFDPNNPPSVCGTVNPGSTLALTLTNVPNKVPVVVNAGGPPIMTANATVLNQPNPAALAGLGGLLLLAAASGGTIALRRSARRH